MTMFSATWLKAVLGYSAPSSVPAGAGSGGTVELRYGVVTQASPLKVQLGNASVGVETRRISSYTPTLSDQVAVLVAASDRLCLGKIAS